MVPIDDFKPEQKAESESQSVFSKKIHRVSYCSLSAVAIEKSHAQIVNIMDVARARNTGLNLTGALTLVKELFYQVLEGPPQAISEVLGSIKRDPRNTGIVMLSEVNDSRRMFAEWSMHFAPPFSNDREHAYELLRQVRDGGQARSDEMIALLYSWSRGSAVSHH